MQPSQDARPRAKSPFAAAFLSLLFPGLGHAYAGASQRALAFAAAPILAFALGAGIALRMSQAELVGFLLLPWVLPGIFLLNLVVLGYRVVAIVDAYRVTAFLNAYATSGGGRLGRPRVPLNPLSAAGLLAVILVMAGGHVALARYDYIAWTTADCVFDPECVSPDASPGPSDSSEPGDSAEPTISLPPEGSAVPNQTAPPWNGKDRLNILLIGADEQGGGHNTDTLIVVSIDPQKKQVAMFSLPRDTVDVPLPPGPARNVLGSSYSGKINSFFALAKRRADFFPGTDNTRGYNGLKAALGELYGLDIKYRIEVNFQGFVKVVDALGGVTVNVQTPVVDEQYPVGGPLKRVYIPAGVQHMSGADALIYARSRKGKFGVGSNDYQRGQRQQRILLSLREQANFGAILPRVNELADALKSSIRTDIPRDIMPQLIGLAESIGSKQIRSYVFAPPRYGREGSRQGIGFVVLPDVNKIRSAVRSAFVVDPGLEDQREKVAEEGAIVWVLNGSGSQGDAANLASYLEYLGLAASAPNQRPTQTGSAATRIVAYNGAAEAMPETAKLLTDLLKVPIQSLTDPTARADIVITTARSTPNLTPPPAP